MPFVNIRIVEGQPEERKAEIARRVVAAVNEVTGIAPTDIWVVFEDIPAADWYVGPRSVRTIRESQRS